MNTQDYLYFLWTVISNIPIVNDMISVRHLAEHISHIQPRDSHERLAFYHFLVNHCEAHMPVDESVINSFTQRVLSHKHWQSHRESLSRELEYCLQSYTQAHPIELDRNKVTLPRDFQVVNIESVENMQAILERHLSSKKQANQKLRIMPQGLGKSSGTWEERFLCLILNDDNSLEVSSYAPWALVDGTQLVPLETDLRLYYTPQMQLDPERIQCLEVDSHLIARFRWGNDGCTGKLLRGYTFQQVASFDGGPLNKFPTLFFPLKRMEQSYINRQTDPMYIELIQVLEKAVDLIRSQHGQSQSFAKAAYERGKLALEQIFPDDKLVRLLVNSLEIAIRPASHLPTQPKQKQDETWAPEKTTPKKFDSTNFSPKPASPAGVKPMDL